MQGGPEREPLWVSNALVSYRWGRRSGRKPRVVSVRCISGGYDAHSEKLSAFRPSATPRAISHDTGAICVYHGHTVLFE